MNPVYYIYICMLITFIPHIANAVFSDYRNFQRFSNPLIFIEILLFLIFLFNRKEKLSSFWKLEKVKGLNSIIIWIVVASLWSIISFTFRLNTLPYNNVEMIKDLIIILLDQFSLFMFIFILYSEDYSKDDLISIAKFFIMFSLLAIAFNIIFKLSEFYKFSSSNWSSMLNFRSFFENRNYFGFLMFCSLVVIHSISLGLGKLSRSFLLILHQVFLFLSMSRNSLIAYLLYVVLRLLLNDSKYFLKFLKERHNKQPIIFKISSLIFLSLLMIVCFSIIKPYFRLENIFSDRIHIWSITFALFRKNWIFGVGVFNTNSYLTSYFGRAIQPHSFLFNGLATLGFFGFSILLIEIFQMFKRISELSNKKDLWPLVVSLVFYSMFESIKFFGMSLFPSLIAILLLLVYHNQPEYTDG